ncbi:nucleotide pyrophosphohydrolase [Olsenella sp. Marseille-QA0557]|uniref:nucleotide pyrophosphohydrolase n=1 Tax=Olsenella sp. Marseille-QA0557 TaxID=3378782 RepID=UPI003D0C6DA5
MDASQKVRTFCDARNWRKFHNPKELSIGLVTESSELLELFRFQSSEQMDAMLDDTQTRQHIGDELADIFFFLLRFADLYNFDLNEALECKLRKNEARYPLETSYGSNKKAN